MKARLIATAVLAATLTLSAAAQTAAQTAQTGQTGQAAVQTAQTPARSNIGQQPDWGPAGYELAEFYYIPALDVYYDVEAAVFRIEENGRWIAVERLPERFGDCDLYACYKVVMNGHAPWRNHTNHTFVYDGYRSKRFRQQTIRASRDPHGKDKDRHNPKRERKGKEAIR